MEIPVKPYTVCFFGHRCIDDIYSIEYQLEELITKLIQKHKLLDFLVGKNGDFDLIVSSVIKRVKRNYRDDNSMLVLVLPYNTSEYRKNENSYQDYYDDIVICQESSSAYFKAAIQIRNKKMVDYSDLVICYVENDYGGAFQTISYAVNQGKEIINLAEKTAPFETERVY